MSMLFAALNYSRMHRAIDFFICSIWLHYVRCEFPHTERSLSMRLRFLFAFGNRQRETQVWTASSTWYDIM